ncbi:hypothetical protein HY029_06315, partial [Candidatus Gottesmanbacteria bacterium]|nr:hypothetical protein [Candidatus Gottesmanbacteria bacterium]
MKFKYYIFSLLLAICGIILIPKVKALADLTPTPNPLLLNLLSTVPTSCYTKQFGDANCDGTINNTDYDIWQLSITNKDVSRIYADFNKDGMVNLLDFEIW